MSAMKISYQEYPLLFKVPFHLSNGVRNHTDSIIVKLQREGITAFGELSLPPYLPYTLTSSKKELDQFISNPCFDVTELKSHSFSAPVNHALTTLLLDFQCKKNNLSIYDHLNIPFLNQATSCFTLSVQSIDQLPKAIQSIQDYPLIKFKVNNENVVEYLNVLVKHWNKPFYLDTNQGWNESTPIQEIAQILNDSGCQMIEQPFSVDQLQLNDRMRNITNIPIIADESFQSVTDIPLVAQHFDGVNIKLMKCGGILNALEIIHALNESHLKVMIGCMTSSSCNLSVASALLHYADFIDLDAIDLIKNDGFQGFNFKNGVINNSKNVSFGFIPDKAKLS